ncbi:MAG: hypothetical protein PVH84_08270 [Candidatus Aminicenantes bacterium]
MNTILILDNALKPKSVRRKIDAIAKRVEQKLLAEETKSDLVWEPVPLETYQSDLPDIIRSSWVFAVRARANTGDERHPNSHQYMMSYKGRGDLQIWIDEDWKSNHLVSTFGDSLESRWVSVPPVVWHRALGSEENWIVVSFHTASADELVEERPEPDDDKKLRQRYYVK